MVHYESSFSLLLDLLFQKRTSSDRSTFDDESEKQKLDKELTNLQQEVGHMVA